MKEPYAVIKLVVKAEPEDVNDLTIEGKLSDRLYMFMGQLDNFAKENKPDGLDFDESIVE